MTCKCVILAALVTTCSLTVAQGLSNARVQLQPLTDGPAASASLNSVLQGLPVGLQKGRLAIELNRLASDSVASRPEEFSQSVQRAKSILLEVRGDAKTEEHRRSIDALASTVLSTEKAFYSRELRRNYPPDTYKTIFERTHFAVALVDRITGSPYCSASFITRNLVLTAAHCITDKVLEDIEIWVNYVQNADGSTTAPDRVRIKSLEYRPSDSALDYVIVGTENYESAELPKNRPCLSTDRVRLRELLYILGHPQQRPLTVHDFAEVLFPYEVTDAELTQIITDQRLLKAPSESIEGIQKSYQSTGGGNFFNKSTVWDGRPTLGIVADTFRGNSGAPVFSRNSHRMVGVFVRGQPDYAEPWQPSWLRHEAVLPMSRIVEDLRKNSKLLVDAGVCVL